MNSLLCRRVKPGFLQTDSGFQQCLTGTRLYLLRNHRKGGMAGKFFRSTVSSSEEYSRTSRPLRPDRSGWRCPLPSV